MKQIKICQCVRKRTVRLPHHLVHLLVEVINFRFQRFDFHFRLRHSNSGFLARNFGICNILSNFTFEWLARIRCIHFIVLLEIREFFISVLEFPFQRVELGVGCKFGWEWCFALSLKYAYFVYHRKNKLAKSATPGFVSTAVFPASPPPRSQRWRVVGQCAHRAAVSPLKPRLDEFVAPPSVVPRWADIACPRSAHEIHRITLENCAEQQNQWHVMRRCIVDRVPWQKCLSGGYKTRRRDCPLYQYNCSLS